jgi:hypothetical protein
MATNAKNLAELLNTDTTVKVGDIEDGSVTTAKLADGGVTTAKIADDAVSTAKLYAENLGRRNLAINGGMQVAQRATSVSSISSGGSYHTCDRWRLAIDTSGTWTQTQETLAVTDPPFVQHGHTKALKMDCTTANGSLSAGSYIQLQYRIEGHDLQRIRTGTSSPAPVTISFWVKATKTGTNIVNVYQDEGGKQVAFSYTINASNTWEHKSITIPGNTHDAINNDNTRGRQFTWYLSAGSNRTSGSLQSTWQNYATGDEAVGQVNHADNTANNFHITGVQIEQGSSATDFDHRPIGEEMMLCQRYFQIHENIQMAAYVNAAYRRAESYFALPTQMRANPSVSTLTTGNSSNIRPPAATYAGIQMAVSKGGANVHMESNGSGYMYINGRKQSLDAEV